MEKIVGETAIKTISSNLLLKMAEKNWIFNQLLGVITEIGQEMETLIVLNTSWCFDIYIQIKLITEVFLTTLNNQNIYYYK